MKGEFRGESRISLSSVRLRRIWGHLLLLGLILRSMMLGMLLLDISWPIGWLKIRSNTDRESTRHYRTEWLSLTGSLWMSSGKIEDKISPHHSSPPIIKIQVCTRSANPATSLQTEWPEVGKYQMWLSADLLLWDRILRSMIQEEATTVRSTSTTPMIEETHLRLAAVEIEPADDFF